MKNSNTILKKQQLLLFGDLCSGDHVDKELSNLLHLNTNPVLEQFYRQVAHDLRKYIGQLSSKHQSLFPRFTTLIDLTSRLGETDGTPVMKFCLLTVFQIAQFIVYYSDKSRSYPSNSDTCCVVGSCTGGFAAAAVGCAPSLMSLVPVAAKAVLASFNTALCSYTVGQRLLGTNQSPGTNDAWSVCIPGDARGSTNLDVAKVKELMEQFRQSLNLAAESQKDAPVWIGATGTNFTSVNGRPDQLREFTSFLSKSGICGDRAPAIISIPIASPYHASHLFDEADVDQVMSPISKVECELFPCHLPLMWPNSRDDAPNSNLGEALRGAVRAALIEPITWDHGQDSIRRLLTQTNRSVSAVSIVPFSCSAIARDVAALLSPAIQTTIQDPTKTQVPGANNYGADSDSASDSKSSSGRFDQSKIAIVGYSGRYPSAASNEAFWELLRRGRDVHREIPSDRFEWEAHYDATGKKKNTSRVKYGCFIDEPGAFDARFFNMSPREAENTDPAQRLAIMAAYEAMEMGGIVRNRTPSTQQDRVGVFFGTTSDDWREVNSGQDVDTYFIPGGNRAFVPGRISYFFRFSGPSLSIDTACSSSFAAISSACNYLWKGDCDTAIAGGTNILTNPDNFAGLDRGHFLSTTGNCNAFDDGASGYCRADAVGAVILKRLEDAQADNDPIMGVIVGSTTNHCGQTESITRPHEGDQASVFKRVMRYANYEPSDISYIEMHGTGTQAGDATEMNSVLSVFAPSAKPGVPQRNSATKSPRSLFLGSAKANIGHAESASGVSSLIKVLMMMKHSEIPPHVGIKTKMNRNYPKDLADRGVNIALDVTAWGRDKYGHGADRKRSAFLNNFSAAGGNTAILLEDAPLMEQRLAGASGGNSEVCPRSSHVVAITAKSKSSLAANLASLILWLEKHPASSLPALSYTTTARRAHHNHRIAVAESSLDDVIKALKSCLPEASELPPIPPAVKTPGVIFMFSGQGTLYAELARTLYRANTTFRANIDTLNRSVQRQGFTSFMGLIDGSVTPSDLENHRVGPIVSQLGLVAIQIGLNDLLTSWGITPSAVIGHSLGEYAAFYASGVLSADDTLYLVGARATLLEQRCVAGTHTMLAVKTTGPRAMEKLMTSIPAADAQKCDLACANQPDVRVIAGPVDTIAEVARKASTIDGLQSIKLQVPFAFHTAQVEPILDDFEQAASARGIVYRAPAVPVLSPLLPGVVQAGVENVLNASYLTRACRQVVKFQEALEATVAAPGLVTDKTIWLEIGCHPACCGMVKSTLGTKYTTLATMRKDVDAYKTLAPAVQTLYLAGIPIDWEEYHRNFPAAHQVIELPRYVWDLKTYWIQYRNNFCLTKGDEAAFNSLPTLCATVAKRLSPSLQRILEEEHGAKTSSLVVESDLFDKDLLPILKGHVVNGATLCPSSLWADAGTAVAKYMLTHQQGPQFSPETTGIDVANVNVETPLIARPDEKIHLFRLTAKANWSRSTVSQIISIAVSSVNDKGKTTSLHVKLEVHLYTNQCWLGEWKRNAHLITSRIDALRAGVDHGTTHMIKRGMAYKLFASLVSYSADYRGMSEVLLDSERLEAVSNVDFQTDPVNHGNFVVDPRWIDSLGHIAGFIMNSSDTLSDASELTPQVFINHGWDRMRIAEPLEREKKYRVYNRMQLMEKSTYSGDTYVLDGDRIVALFEGVTFQGVPKKVLDRLLPGAASKPTTTTKQTETVVESKKTTDPAKLTIDTTVQVPRQDAAKPDNFAKISLIICEEVGVSAAELKPEVDFADLGIDSLLALNVLSRLREEVLLDLSPSLFLNFPTVGELRRFINGETEDETMLAQAYPSRKPSLTMSLEASSEEDSSSTDDSSPDVTFAQTTPTTTTYPDHSFPDSLPQATVVRLAGKTEDAKAVLFLFPDGAGSATAYAPLAPHLTRAGESQDVVVYGLNCPWLKHGAEMTKLGITIETMAALFLDRIRQVVKEHTPARIAFGGWSAGGVLAFEALRQLHHAQSRGPTPPADAINVDRIVFFDSPNPIGLQNPPARMYTFFKESGVFGSNVPAWLFPHFEAFLRALDAYTPVPMTGALPGTEALIFYARDGLCKGPDGPQMETTEDDPREMLWLLRERTDFSAEGWKSLVPGGPGSMNVRVLDGVNHFTMMKEVSTLKDVGQVAADFILDD